jgi:CO/xanthine dehydrogenase FAD-binding subunit
MRAYLPEYEIRSPKTLSDALDLLSREVGVWKPFAGGTDLMVLFESGKLNHKHFINILPFRELKQIEITTDYVTIGGLTTYTQIQSNEILQKEFSMLCKAASETGGLAIQNRGTLGGNIANASPAADSPPTLLAYDADVELISSSGLRWVSYKDFHLGYKQIVMRQDELISRIRLPRTSKDWKTYYRKVGTRKAQAISKVCFAGAIKKGNGRIADVRIVFGSVAPVPLRCVETEGFLRGQILDRNLIQDSRFKIQNEIKPIDDIRSTASYRGNVSANLLEDFLMVAS